MDITVRGLQFSYDEVTPILKGIDLIVCGGEIVAIVGPNGSGKTTFLKIVSGLLAPTAGTVSLGNKSTTQLSSRQIAKRLSALEQEREVGFDFTVREVVAMGRFPYQRRFSRESQADRKRIGEAMRHTAVTSFADRSIRELSGGERQRVFLAMALAQEPRALLLDEPTTHLDINYQIQIMEIVRRQAAAGLTVLMSLHDLNLASQYADRIALLHQGRLLAVGSPAGVLTEKNIKKAFHTDVTVGRNPMTNSIYIDTVPSRMERTAELGRLHIVCGGGSGVGVMHALADRFLLSVGVLSPLDTDFEVARHLGLTVVMEAPFAPISEEAHAKNLAAMRLCDGVIVCETSIGSGNLLNLEAVVEIAVGMDIFILTPDTIEERDFTGGQATNLVHRLLEAGAVAVNDADELKQHLLSPRSVL